MSRPLHPLTPRTPAKAKTNGNATRRPQPPLQQVPQQQPHTPQTQTQNYVTRVYTLRSSGIDETKPRTHLMRIHSNVEVNPVNFNPPIKLLKKDIYLAEQEEADGEEKEAAAPMDTSVIAPYGGAVHHRQNLFKRKTRHVYTDRQALTDRRQRLRDGQPWMLEDDDRKNSFEGRIQGQQKPHYAILVREGDTYRFMPISKQYQFNRRPNYRVLDCDEAEAAYEARQKRQGWGDRWMMRRKVAEDEANVDAQETLKPEEAAARVSRVTKLIAVDASAREGTGAGDSEYLDFDADELFQDDEEGHHEAGEEDEEERAGRDKQAREMREAEADEEPARAGQSNSREPEEGGGDEASAYEMSRTVRKLGTAVAMVGEDDSEDEEDPYAKDAGVVRKTEEEKERERQELFQQHQQPTDPAQEGGEGATPADNPSTTQSGSGSGGAEGSSQARKRSSPGAESANKQLKTQAQASVQPTQDPDANLITEEEIIKIIASAKLTTKELIARLSIKMNRDKRNGKIISEIVLRVAAMRANVLVLKPQYMQ